MSHSAPPDIIDAAQLTALAMQPLPDREAFPPTRALVIDAAAPAALDPSGLEPITQWLHRQPRPVIGFGLCSDDHLPLFDTIAATEAELAAMLATVEHCPQAAGVLIQTLRITADLSPAAALAVESLAYATLQSGKEFHRWLASRPPAPPPPASSREPAVLLHRADETLWITLNRPENDNAMSAEMRDALVEAFQLAATDRAIQAVQVSARGAMFSSGGDLKEFGSVSDPATAHQIRGETLPAKFLLPRGDIYHFHVHRACIGAGIEMPAFAGRLTAEPKTFFWLPELSMGLIPGAGGCVSLPRRIGRQRTAWLALTGKKINAQRALQWGLIDAIESRDTAAA